MKNKLIIFVAVMCAWACSSPKYTYHFDTYDYNSGRKQVAATTAPVQNVTQETESPLAIDPVAFEASTGPTTEVPAQTVDTKALSEQIKSMSKSEKRQLKNDVKEAIKSLASKGKKVDSDQRVKASKAMDSDLKMAIIFGVVAIVLSAFGGVSSIFWILGVAALVVAIIFLIKWLSRQ